VLSATIVRPGGARRDEATLLAIAQSGPQSALSYDEIRGQLNLILADKELAKVEAEVVPPPRRRYVFHPDEVAEAEAQGLPYVLVPRF
jgi:hypothetical protein